MKTEQRIKWASKKVIENLKYMSAHIYDGEIIVSVKKGRAYEVDARMKFPDYSESQGDRQCEQR